MLLRSGGLACQGHMALDSSDLFSSGSQKCVLRMDLVHLKVLVFRSAFVLMVFTDTSV